jgi:hypothetical protein
MARRTPVLDAVEKRRPIIGMLARMAGALFAKGGDITLPATPATVSEETGEVIPPQQPVTISIPHGIARDPANISIAVTVLFAIAAIFRWDVFGLSKDQVQELYMAGTVIFGTISGVLRTKSKNITRG